METIHQVRGPAGPAHSAAPKDFQQGMFRQASKWSSDRASSCHHPGHHIRHVGLELLLLLPSVVWWPQKTSQSRAPGVLDRALTHRVIDKNVRQSTSDQTDLLSERVRYLGVVSRMIIKALDKLRVKFRRRKHRRRGKHRRKQKSRGKWWKRQLTDKSALRLKALRVLPYKKVPQCSRAESECTICLATFKNIDQCRILPCKHFFHRECIDKWLKERSDICPLCTRPAIHPKPHRCCSCGRIC